jgi:hypothetical protein
MPVEVAARKIIRAERRRRRELILTLHGKIGVFLARHFSGFAAWAMLQVATRGASKLGLHKQ